MPPARSRCCCLPSSASSPGGRTSSISPSSTDCSTWSEPSPCSSSSTTGGSANERASRRGELDPAGGRRILLHRGRDRRASHAGFLHSAACSGRQRYARRGASPARPDTAVRLVAGRREARHHRLAAVFREPRRVARARQGGPGPRRAAGARRGGAAIEALIPHVLLAAMAATVVAMVLQRNLLG